MGGIAAACGIARTKSDRLFARARLPEQVPLGVAELVFQKVDQGLFLFNFFGHDLDAKALQLTG